MASFSSLSYDVVYWMVNKYFGSGPLFQLILLQFVCKRLRKAVLQPHSQCLAQLEDLRNTAPMYRRVVFTDIGAKVCKYGSLSIACWFRDRLHFPMDEKWSHKAAQSKRLSYIHCFYLLTNL